MFAVLWWIVVGLGLIASGTFLALHRPRNWFRANALNATGWVIIIFLLYLRTAMIVAGRGWVPASNSNLDAFFAITFGFLIDVLLIYRVKSFLDYQRQLKAIEVSRGTDLPARRK